MSDQNLKNFEESKRRHIQNKELQVDKMGSDQDDFDMMPIMKMSSTTEKTEEPSQSQKKEPP